MAVESRFVVIRQGVEVETFMDKKAADEYDKMLDMADSLSEMFENCPIEITENTREELSIFLAQNREEVLVALQAKKAKAAVKKVVQAEKEVIEKPEATLETETVVPTKVTKATTRKTRKTPVKEKSE